MPLHPLKFTVALALLAFSTASVASITAPAHAQFFGVSLDAAIAYSATDQPVSGGSVGVTHPVPFVPNLGGSGVYFERRAEGGDGFDLASKVKFSVGEIFYNIPVPLFSLAVGLGGGVVDIKTGIITDAGTVEEIRTNTGVGSGFVRFGLPFFSLLDFHVGYHFYSTPEVDLIKDASTDVSGITTKVNFSGGLSTIGFQIAL